MNSESIFITKFFSDTGDEYDLSLLRSDHADYFIKRDTYTNQVIVLVLKKVTLDLALEHMDERLSLNSGSYLWRRLCCLSTVGS